MTLASGTRLGPHEIVSPIGKGGMGEIYKANDTRLDRAVAIKVLPPHFAESAERRERFEREAKAISQLNHPHICTLYDVGEQDGIHYLVMEYIEGETLAERLKKGALRLDKALECGFQVADGLAKAHRVGIVHRDLKPGNIMLTKRGESFSTSGWPSPRRRARRQMTPTLRRVSKTSPKSARSWERCSTWLRSNWKATGSMGGRTSSPLARFSTRSSQERRLSPARAKRA